MVREQTTASCSSRRNRRRRSHRPHRRIQRQVRGANDKSILPVQQWIAFDQDVWKMPHDTFSPDRITVNKGDNVVIYYRNIEDTTEDHNFHMDSPYTFDVVVHAGQTENFPVVSTLHGTSDVTIHVNQTATITFRANWAGVFPYQCLIHQPTMTG